MSSIELQPTSLNRKLINLPHNPQYLFVLQEMRLKSALASTSTCQKSASRERVWNSLAFDEAPATVPRCLEDAYRGCSFEKYPGREVKHFGRSCFMKPPCGNPRA